MTHYLKFPNEEIGMQALRDFGCTIIDGNGKEQIVSASHEYTIDIVGVIYNEDYELDPETLEVSKPATAVDGWHVNFIGTLPSEWEPYLVNPSSPRRIFFGVS